MEKNNFSTATFLLNQLFWARYYAAYLHFLFRGQISDFLRSI